jgi:hypothetical protein
MGLGTHLPSHVTRKQLTFIDGFEVNKQQIHERSACHVDTEEELVH